ncbi:Ribonuclease H [Quillaja saponaria]|uniref:Ribonuclease H n=1 Tax=Quillaja saponaria TaxID=32244 RepID=A0AAD7LHB2_QUISA|nr:Ribonuclease H [Quillaja saponaria]
MPRKNGGPGHKQLQHFNTAFLAKACWRCLKEPDSLWVKVMIAKYVQGGDVLRAAIKPGISRTWRNILSTLEMVKEGIRWMIGDGKLVNFWLDRWVSMKPVIEELNVDSHGANLDMMVAEVMDDNGAWNREIIDLLVSPAIGKQILGYPLSRSHDLITWGYTKNGCFNPATTIVQEMQI